MTACVLLAAGLVFGEFVALFAVGVAVEVTWRDRSLRRAWIWAVALGLYALWWIAYYQPYLSHHSLSLVPKFVANMAFSAAGGLFGRNLEVGRFVLLAVVAFVGWRVWRRGRSRLGLSRSSSSSGSYWLFVAYSRAALGQPYASRYVYSGAVLLARIIAESCRGVRLSAPVPGRRRRRRRARADRRHQRVRRR